MRRVWRRCGAWLMLLALAGCGVDRGACGLVKVADLPVTANHGRPLVTGEINGKPVHLIVDTGAAGMAITQAAITRLGLRFDDRIRIEMRGVGGSSSNFAAMVSGLKLGTAEVPDQRAGVLPLLAGANDNNADGVISLPVLQRFDVDLDVPHRRIGLYTGRLCTGEKLPIPGPATPIEIGYTHDQPHMLLPVELDGKRYQAMLDTGAQRSLVLAHATGLPTAPQPGDRALMMTGVGPSRRSAYLHRFQQLRVGSDVVERPYLIVVNDVGVDIDLILGMDFFAQRRAFLSFSTGRVYLQPQAPK